MLGEPIEIAIGIAIEIETIGHLNTIRLMSYASRVGHEY